MNLASLAFEMRCVLNLIYIHLGDIGRVFSSTKRPQSSFNFMVTEFQNIKSNAVFSRAVLLGVSIHTSGRGLHLYQQDR